MNRSKIDYSLEPIFQEPYEVRLIGFDLDKKNVECAKIIQNTINEELMFLRENHRIPCYMKLITDLNGNIRFYYIYHKDANIPSKEEKIGWSS